MEYGANISNVRHLARENAKGSLPCAIHSSRLPDLWPCADAKLCRRASLVVSCPRRARQPAFVLQSLDLGEASPERLSLACSGSPLHSVRHLIRLSASKSTSSRHRIHQPCPPVPFQVHSHRHSIHSIHRRCRADYQDDYAWGFSAATMIVSAACFPRRARSQCQQRRYADHSASSAAP